MTPKKLFFTKGVGRHRERLASFEIALRDAGIEKFNLVHVSSIFPPNCRVIPKEKGLQELRAGEIVYCVLARNETNENNRLIVASIGNAVPADPNAYGYLSEHHSYGETDEKAGEYAEDLAASMLATTLGIEFDAEKSWDEREQIYKTSGKIIRSRNITQSAQGKAGTWTTVIAAAVFVEEGENDTHQNLNDTHVGQQIKQPEQILQATQIKQPEQILQATQIKQPDQNLQATQVKQPEQDQHSK